jgi:hypothetical protein
LVDGPASAGVAAPPLLRSAPIFAAALSRPVPWPPVDTTVCGISRPISETIFLGRRLEIEQALLVIRELCSE